MAAAAHAAANARCVTIHGGIGVGTSGAVLAASGRPGHLGQVLTAPRSRTRVARARVSWRLGGANDVGICATYPRLPANQRVAVTKM
jgi:hypothetical protein